MNRKKRIIAKAIFAVLIAVMLFACKPEGEKVTGVVLDHRELKADIGQTVTLTATVLPAEAADPKVSWEAVPKGIVELTPDGALCTVKAVKDGAAVVTVTTEDGGFTAICTVTVLPVPAESVTLDRETVSLVLGNPAAETATLTATVFPENATDKTVIWSAEPADAVKLTDYKDGRCTVKALKVGETVVTATAADGGFTATCTVTVSQIAAESIELDRDELNLIVGNPAADTATLTAIVSPENAANKTVRWTVGAEGIVDLIDSSDGSCTLRARSIGNVTVTATAEDGGFTATCTVTVVPVAAESVELNRDELNLIWGDPAADTATLTATVFPENAANKTVSWSVDKTGCIDLTDNKDGSCTLRARSVGNVTVTATAEDGSHTATCTVTVTPLAVESVALDRDRLNLILGKPAAETATLTAVVSPGNAVNKTVIWSAEPAEMVSLTDNGNGRCTVKALKVGETVVTATAVDGGHVAKCTVTVTSVRAERVELNSYGVRLILGNKETLTATLTATVFPENAPNKAVSWSVEPENIVGLTVGEDSRCTIRALNVGHAVVTVTAEDGGETASCRVTVSPTYAESIALNREKVDLLLSSEGGETETLTATVSPKNTTNKTVIWSAEPADAVKLTDNGNGSCTVEALKLGAVAVTATAADGSGHTATCTVTVSPVTAESVTLEQKKLNLLLSSEGGETATLTATVSPENTTNKTVSWSAEPADAVKLIDRKDGSCTVEALKVGETVVTATAEDGGHTATCTVTVAPVAAESVSLEQKKLNLLLSSEGGETATLTATVFPENTLNKTVSWSAEPADAVKLTDRKDGSCTVEALKVGETVVTATAEDGGHAATCTVTVSPVLPESIELDRDELKLVYGDSTAGTATLTATVSPENTLNKTIIWSAEPADAVKLTDNGNGSCTVTALGGESAIVTAVSVANPAATAACRISFDYLYLTNTALIKAIDTRGRDSAGNRISVGWTKESDGTVKLTPENLQKIRAVTELNLDGFGVPSEEELEDLGGIEYFTGLTYLSCGGNNLTTLDVSGCTALTYLNCGANNLTTLDVSGCTALTYLICDINDLTTLDVTNNTALTSLNCGDNNLTTLNVSGCTALTELSCDWNDLTTLDASGCTALANLYCFDNNLTTLDVSGCTALTELSCARNRLTTLDVSGCTALTFLNCDDNRLRTLDIRHLPLNTLFCTPQTESDGVTIRRLTLKLTREQKSELRLGNGIGLYLEVYD